MITLDNISYKNSERFIFRNLGITIGECSCVVIRNCDEFISEILLKIICCLSFPSEGRILYYNEEIEKHNIKDYYSLINYTGKKSTLHRNMTVEENLRFLASLGSDEQSVDATMNFFSLEKFAKFYPDELPYKIKKIVSLSRLLACPRKIWLLDDPFSDLDEKDKLLLMSVINTGCHHGRIVIIVCNERNEKLLIDNYIELDIKDFFNKI